MENAAGHRNNTGGELRWEKPHNTKKPTNTLNIPLAPRSPSQSIHSRQADQVWIAEDNVDLQLLLDRAFKRTHSGVHPVFFHNGAELVDYFRAQRNTPKLLLLDLQMPVMDGLEALKKLRAQGCCGGAPVVIFSSLENPDLIRSAYFAGAKLFLKKPHALEEYNDVAKLCATGAEAIRELPASAIPSGALDVKRVLKLVAEDQPFSSS